MQEALLIVPKTDNDGRDLTTLRDRIAGQMCESFGGVTETDSRGLWKDSTGKLYAEPVTELVSAADDNAANRAELETLAREVIRDGNQHAAYLRLPNGNVEIVHAKEESSNETIQG